MKMSSDAFDELWPKIKGHEIIRISGLNDDHMEDLYRELLVFGDTSRINPVTRYKGGKLTAIGELFTYGEILQTKVVNMYKDAYDVNITRTSAIYGNPFKLWNPSDDLERIRCLIRFVDYLIGENPRVLDHVESLHGKTLGCVCAPRMCHGDIYKSLTRVERSDYKDLLQATRLDLGAQASKIEKSIQSQPIQLRLI